MSDVSKDCQRMVRNKKIGKLCLKHIQWHTILDDMEFTGVTKIKTKFGDNKVQMVAPEHEEFNKELVTHQDANKRDWVTLTRFSCKGVWIKHVMLDDSEHLL